MTASPSGWEQAPDNGLAARFVDLEPELLDDGVRQQFAAHFRHLRTGVFVVRGGHTYLHILAGADGFDVAEAEGMERASNCEALWVIHGRFEGDVNAGEEHLA